MTRPRRQNKNKRSNRNNTRNNRNSNNPSSNMSQLVAIQRTQERSLPPQLLDVPKLLVARERLMMFERSYSLGNLSANSTAPTSGTIRFQLDALPNNAEFTALFDAYRILQATVTFFPLVAMNSVASAAVSPSLYTVIDYDDDNTIAIADALQYPSLMQSVTGSVVERTLNPVAAIASYSGTFTSYARAPRTMFMDAASPSVRYYGLKYVVDTGSNNAALWTITVRVILQCKDVR